MKRYFTIEEVKETIAEKLSWYSDYYCDLHNEVANTDYYIIGYYEAEEALKQYGLFEAIGKVRDYENDVFGEVYTDLSDPEKIANMLFYIIAEEYMYGDSEFGTMLMDHWDDIADDETNEQLLEALDME